MTLLITGGAGFIGGNFALQAVARGHHIVNLDLLTYAGNLDTIERIANCEQHTFVQGDICDATLVRQLLIDHRPRAIVNFAAESHVDRSIDGPAAFIQTNVVGTFVLLEAATEYWRALPPKMQSQFCFLHVSTDEVYGSIESGAAGEGHPYAPNSPYAATKASSDHLVRAFSRTYSLPTLTTHCSNNYGPYQFPEKLIPLMIQRALAGESLPVYGDGSNVRDWLHVHDHCEALFDVLERGQPGETYNIGGGATLENIALVRQLCALLDAKRPRRDRKSYACQIEFVKDRPGHDQRYCVDSTRIQRELGWFPKVSLVCGLDSTIDWYVDNQPWVHRVLNGSYRLERIGQA